MDGAAALALPTKYGQYLHVEQGENQQIGWKSHDSDHSVWFEDVITFDEIKQKKQADPENPIKNTLIAILHQAYLQNPAFVDDASGYQISTELTFPRLWGLGTSSTLINNIAQWCNTDAFELLQQSFGGSGYDIACAQNNTPIVYQLEKGKPVIKPVIFRPAFSEQLYFVYLNQKQNSRTAIANYHQKKTFITKAIEKINQITTEIVGGPTINDFKALVQTHETILSEILEIKTVKESLFPDFKGTVKSLGAWGGDFVLVASEDDPTAYFEALGYKTIIPYREIIK